jgi:hypothetical protein
MMMQFLAIIGEIGTNHVDSVTTQVSLDAMVSSLETPSVFWIVIILGMVFSPFMVHPRSGCVNKKAQMYLYVISAILFFLSIMAFLHVRDSFVLIFADLLPPAYGMLSFPILLGSSPLGAALLIFAWYYAHPVYRLKAGQDSTKTSILRTFTPMMLMFLFVSFAITIGFFIRLV